MYRLSNVPLADYPSVKCPGACFNIILDHRWSISFISSGSLFIWVRTSGTYWYKCTHNLPFFIACHAEAREKNELPLFPFLSEVYHNTAIWWWKKSYSDLKLFPPLKVFAHLDHYHCLTTHFHEKNLEYVDFHSTIFYFVTRAFKTKLLYPIAWFALGKEWGQRTQKTWNEFLL